MKAEVRAALAKHGVARFVIKPVRRSYAFERPGVPHGLQWVLKVRYPASAPALPLDLAGVWPPRHLPSPVLRLQGRPARQAPWALHMPCKAPRPSQHAGAHPHDRPRTLLASAHAWRSGRANALARLGGTTKVTRAFIGPQAATACAHHNWPHTSCQPRNAWQGGSPKLDSA